MVCDCRLFTCSDECTLGTQDGTRAVTVEGAVRGEAEVRGRLKWPTCMNLLAGVVVSHVGCANIYCVKCPLCRYFLCFLCSVPAVLVFRLQCASSLWVYGCS